MKGRKMRNNNKGRKPQDIINDKIRAKEVKGNIVFLIEKKRHVSFIGKRKNELIDY